MIEENTPATPPSAPSGVGSAAGYPEPDSHLRSGSGAVPVAVGGAATGTQPNPHTHCDNAGKDVHCDRCRRRYVCTPADDLYCTPDGDHACEQCLVGDLPLYVFDADEHGFDLDEDGELWFAATRRIDTVEPTGGVL